jgi:hypothetical protein
VTYSPLTGSLRLYANGELVDDTQVGPLDLDIASKTFSIGRREPLAFGQDGVTFNGALDEVGLYSRPLAASEIRSIFEAGSKGRCAARPGVAGADCADAVADLEAELDALATERDALALRVAAVEDANAAFLGAIEADLRRTFRNPSFTIPGATAEEKLAALQEAILGLNLGRKQGLFDGLRGRR